MTKLCPRGKAAAKRKFDVYPSAYANAYASKICAGKIKDPSGTKRKDFKGPKPAGKAMGGRILPEKFTSEPSKRISPSERKNTKLRTPQQKQRQLQKLPTPKTKSMPSGGKRRGMMGGGMTMMPRAMYGKGGGVCKKGMGRAYGKNS